MLETEYKSLIDEELYNKIEKAYKWNWVKEQINHYYFDNSLQLSEKKITVRVREKDGKYVLQVKSHKTPDGSLHVSEEKEFGIDCAPEFIDEKTAFDITGIDTGKLTKTGELTTLRHSLMWNNATEICLDKSMYLDRVDYEIEIEYTGDTPTVLMEELKLLGVDFSAKVNGKYSRFLKRLREIINGK